MNKLNPEYQRILDAAVGIDQYQFDQLADHLQMWDRNKRIQQAFWSRSDGITAEQKKRELSETYHLSLSSIDKILYEL